MLCRVVSAPTPARGPTYSWSVVDQTYGNPARMCLRSNLTNFLAHFWPRAAGCKQ
jgi:hypothetical protein